MFRLRLGRCSRDPLCLWKSGTPLTPLSSSLLCLQKVVEEEKQEHVDKVKELLGWALGLKQSTQGRMAAAGSRELGDIEKSISEQQVDWGQPSGKLFNFCSFSTAELNFFLSFFHFFDRP